ncbi:MAG: pilus assembly protein PilP [Proteobacteria bacterium]|nr:pilus assembly protein PilP [Pseudomonadota bacterium]
MDKHLTQINIAFGILCLIQLIIGCGDKKEPPQKAVAVSKKIVAKSNAVSAPVQATAVEAEKQAVSSQQQAIPVSSETLTSDKVQQDAGVQADKRIAGVPSPAEQIIASVSQTEIAKMQPEGTAGYNPEGKIDPFAPLFKEGVASSPEKQDKERRIPRTPLEMVDLGQLKLVAIMHAKSGNKALVEEASGKGYIVAKGSYMGLNSGRVAKILKDSIIIEEETENMMGKRSIQERELKLQKPLGEE